MMITSKRLLLCSALAALALGACTIPKVSVRQTMPLIDTMRVGGSLVRHYQARDYATLDSADKILRFEYLPVDVFAVVDARDSVTDLFSTAWQTYLWRFSERLSPVDKQYYIPVPISVASGSDSLRVVWGYPQIDERDEDLKYVVRRRNEYWSVDRMTAGEESQEVWVGPIKSFPQYAEYSPFGRFTAGGSYARAMADSAVATRAAITELARYLAKNNGSDSTGR